LVFDPQSVNGLEIHEDADYAGIRILFWARLGKSRIRMQVDVNFSDEITPTDMEVEYPTLLLEMPVPLLRGYPPETVIAEKLQAMVYLGEINSRMKDFYDILLLSQSFDFDGVLLQKAIETTFRNRNTPLPLKIPPALTDQFALQKQSMWETGFLRKFLSDLGKLANFAWVVHRLKMFLWPPLSASSKGKAFNQFWKADKRWSSKPDSV